jgi:ubiquinone biosynthesis protein
MNEKRRAINACEVLNRESRLVIDVMHLKRVGNQLDRAANRMTVGIVVAALIIGSSIIMTVPGGPKLLGLPFFGLFRFLGTLIGVGWLLISIRRNRGEQ